MSLRWANPILKDASLQPALCPILRPQSFVGLIPEQLAPTNQSHNNIVHEIIVDVCIRYEYPSFSQYRVSNALALRFAKSPEAFTSKECIRGMILLVNLRV